MIAIVIILSILFVAMFASFITLFTNYKYYKKTYNALVNKEIELAYNLQDQYIFKKKEDLYSFTDEYVVFFTDTKDIKLYSKKPRYIHNELFTFFDFYSMYWLNKLYKWFDENYKK